VVRTKSAFSSGKPKKGRESTTTKRMVCSMSDAGEPTHNVTFSEKDAAFVGVV
jgi:hypothetical protein